MSEAQATSATLTWVLSRGDGAGLVRVETYPVPRRQAQQLEELTQRCAFAGLVFLSVFGFVAYALWKFGAPLSMGLVELGRLPAMAWFPLVTVLWAGLTYLVLLVNTRKGRYEEPS